MAGDWIKMRAALTTCPKVVAIARSIGKLEELAGLSRQAVRLLVVGGLHAVWSAVNEHTSDGVMANAYLEDVDDIAGIPGFGLAMQLAGWLEVDEACATLTFPNFGQWNTPAKDSTAAERMRKHREKQRVAQQAVTVTAPLRVTVTPDKTRQDKSEYIPAAPVPTSKPPAASGSRAKAAVSWSADAGWQGITDADRSEWAAAYPGAVIDQELAKATAWLRANPKRCGKRNWRRFLVGWLQRCQDKGGTNRTPGERPGVTGPAPVPMDKRRYWRGKAGRSMTDDEYQAWMAAQARDGPTSDGASVGDLLARTLTEGTR
jgi:hypothetical protein